VRYGGQSDWMLAAGAAQAAASPCIDVTGPPRGWRVTLLPLTKPNGTPVTEALGDIPRCRVEYGIQNIGASVDVDWPFQGTRFDLAAGALRVSGLATPGAAVPGRGSSSNAIRFRAWAAPFYGDERATRTIVVGSILTGTTSPTQPIPTGATDVVVWAESDSPVSDVASPEALRIRWAGPSVPVQAHTRYLAALDANNIAGVPAGYGPFVGEDSPAVKMAMWSVVPPMATTFAVDNPATPGSGNLFNVCVQFRCAL